MGRNKLDEFSTEMYFRIPKSSHFHIHSECHSECHSTFRNPTHLLRLRLENLGDPFEGGSVAHLVDEGAHKDLNSTASLSVCALSATAVVVAVG